MDELENNLLKNNKIISNFQLGCLLVALVLLVSAYLVLSKAGGDLWLFKVVEKACTAEAKICPDGSGVGRTGPNCEFAACSGETDDEDISGWQTYRNEEYGFEFRYPKDWLMEKNAGINFKPSIVSITGPETRKVIDEAEGSGGYCEGCGPNISFYHHQALTDISGYDVTSITELVAKDPTYTKLGTRKIGELSMTEMRVGGLGSYYDLIIDRGEKGIFEIFFGWAEGPDELTETENQILSTFKFIY